MFDRKLSVHRLRKIFQEHRVKRRVLNVKVKYTPKQLENQVASRNRAFTEVLKIVRDKRRRIYFMDEAVFSSNQVKLLCWNAYRAPPMQVEKKKLAFKAVAVAGATDINGNVIALHTVDGAITTESFLDFLDKV